MAATIREANSLLTSDFERRLEEADSSWAHLLPPPWKQWEPLTLHSTFSIRPVVCAPVKEPVQRDSVWVWRAKLGQTLPANPNYCITATPSSHEHCIDAFLWEAENITVISYRRNVMKLIIVLTKLISVVPLTYKLIKSNCRYFFCVCFHYLSFKKQV